MKYYVTKKDQNNWFDVVSPFDSLFDTFFQMNSNESIKEHTPCLVDIEKTDESYLLTAELPGFSSDNISVKVENNILTIEASKESVNKDESDEKKEKQEKNAKVPTTIVRERSYKSYKRSFELPDDANSDEIKAKMEHGVLSLTIPRNKKSQPKLIKIDAA